MAEMYTFEDWLENRFYNVKDVTGEYVANDSNKYYQLASMGLMTYETVYQIQDAQKHTYDYGIKFSIYLDELGFERRIKESIDLKESIILEIKAIEDKISANMDLYRVIIDGRGPRGLKIGASFILPEEYKAAKSNDLVDFHIPVFSKYGLDTGNGLIYFPTPEQCQFREMEVRIKWLKILKQKLEELNKPEAERLPSFKDIFNPNNNSFQVCIDLLEDLEITNNGIGRLKKGRIGALTGSITAMKQTLNFFKQDYNEIELLQYFNTHLNTDYKTFSKRNKEYLPSLDDAKRFIKNAFKK